MKFSLRNDILSLEVKDSDELMEILLDCPELWRIVEGELGFHQRVHFRDRSQARFSGSINIAVQLPIEDDDVESDRETDLRENAVKGTI